MKIVKMGFFLAGLITIFTPVCLGVIDVDFNHDGYVGFDDLYVFLEGWLNAEPNADPNVSDVNFIDFAFFANQWSPPPVPPGDPNDIYAEFNSDSSEVIVQRNSWAVQETEQFLDIAPNNMRIDTVCVTSALNPSPFFNYKPKAVDPCRGIVLCTNLMANSEFQYILYKTTDGVSFTQILNIWDDTTEPFKTYYDAMLPTKFSIWGVAVMNDGSWLMSIGIYDIFKGTDANESVRPSGRIYRLANPDDSNCTWTLVCNMPFGYVPEWGWLNKTGPNVVVGEYGHRLQYNHPRCIFMSEDYGATWTRIYTPDPTYAYNPTTGQWEGQHTHQAVFAPDSNYNAVYVSCGDGAGWRTLYRLEKTDDGWVKTKDVGSYHPVAALTEGNSIYWGSDQDNMGASIMRHWCEGSIDKFEPLMKRPWPEDDPAKQSYRPYRNALNKGFVFCIIKYADVYYAILSEESTTIQSVAGIYVSADLKHWICAYRELGQVGPLFIAGYCNGKMWASSQETVSPYQQRKGFTFPPLTAKTVDAMQCQRGLTNQFSTADNSTFDISKGDWKFYYDVDFSQSNRVDGIGLHGNSCLKLVHSGTTVQQGLAEARSPYNTVVPHIGDLITFSWWMKTADSWPDGYDVSIRIGGAGAGTGIDYLGDWNIHVKPGAWCKYSLTAKVTGPSVPNICLCIRIYNHYWPPTTDAALYIDCAQMVYLPDRFVPDTSFQVGGGTRDNEVLIFPLSDVGDTFTTIFEWHPETGYKNFLADIPIAKWVGTDGNSICLFWEQSSQLIKLTDANDTVASVDVSYPFLHNNFKRFALLSDSNGSMIYIQDALHGINTFGDGSSIKLTAPLSALKLGVNAAETDFGCGNFCNVRVWKRKLSAEEIIGVFDKPDPIITR